MKELWEYALVDDFETGKPGEAEFGSLLGDGWEPFAITNATPTGPERIHLRRKISQKAPKVPLFDHEDSDVWQTTQEWAHAFTPEYTAKLVGDGWFVHAVADGGVTVLRRPRSNRPDPSTDAMSSGR